MAAFAITFCLGLLLPFMVAGSVYGLAGPGVWAAALGFAAWLTVVASYVVIAFKSGLYDDQRRT
jgi:hypothetical protein